MGAQPEHRGVFQGGRGKASSSGVPPLLPKCYLPTPPPQQGQLGPMTYISSPDFSKQISESCPTGMSSASSGVSELDVMSLKCHKHSQLAVSAQAHSLAGVQRPSPEHMGSPSYHRCRDRARRPCVWGATGARLGRAGQRGVGGQQGHSDLPGTNGLPSFPTPGELQPWGKCPAPRMPTSQCQSLTRRACSGPSPRNKGKVKGREVARAEGGGGGPLEQGGQTHATSPLPSQPMVCRPENQLLELPGRKEVTWFPKCALWNTSVWGGEPRTLSPKLTAFLHRQGSEMSCSKGSS